MMGKEIKPMEITAAATTPVVAASRAPTKITAIATPPRTGPKTWPTVSSRSSAMPDFCKMMPMKVKNGIASSVSFCMMLKIRKGKAWNKEGGKMPASMPIKPKPKPQAASANATGKPVSSNVSRPPNMMGTKFCAKKVSCINVLPMIVVLFFPRPAILFLRLTSLLQRTKHLGLAPSKKKCA